MCHIEIIGFRKIISVVVLVAHSENDWFSTRESGTSVASQIR